ncbi:zinc-binding alcohol dehydrogenase family protein [Pantoea agglomerans]|uniref:quinone oxidoreductase family protein n=1 Tax=Enterobacter agglomerans TaxID=549 RepID=UPI0013C082CC|nr:zinc-binding alcohol dehydrogenase family protein [Pantoea agglomerans]MDY0994053.1 zinc-binding alcohol dehydrogenase family protein [Pantoea agglomerans]NEH21169.1 zinc-binding dehydrogenase [Pantoea agglomerans]
MKAAIINKAGEKPVYGEYADPKPNENQVVIKVKATAISQLAKSRAAGKHYSSEIAEPFIPGIDGTGYLPTGELVYFLSFNAPWGSMAEKTLVSLDNVVRLPATLDPVLAAAIANPGMSSWAALTRRAYLKEGETVLINGATGTSGGLAIRIARYLGAGKIIATGRNKEVLEKLRNEGADVVLTLDSLTSELPALMSEGIDVVLDYLWGQSALDIMTAAIAGGARTVRFVQIGSLSGQEISLHSKLLRSSGLTLMGSGLGSVSDKELLSSISELFLAASKSDLSVPFMERYFFEVADAWSADDSRCRTVFTL